MDETPRSNAITHMLAGYAADRASRRTRILAMLRKASTVEGPDRSLDEDLIREFFPGQHHDDIFGQGSTSPLTASIDKVLHLVRVVLPGWNWRLMSGAEADDAWLVPDYADPVRGDEFRRRFPAGEHRPVDYFETDIMRTPPGFPALALVVSFLTALLKVDDIEAEASPKAA